MGPHDYTSAFANVGSSYEAAMRGLKDGVAIRQLETERTAAAAKAQQQAQMQADLAVLSRNPTPAAIASMMVKYPSLSEDLKRGADVAGEAQQQAQLEHGTQVYAAVLNNQPDVARRLLTERATALRNSGNEREASAADAFATMITDHPELAKTTIGVRLAAAMGPDKFTEAFGKIGAEQRAGDLHTDLVRKGKADADKATSDATTAEVQAKYAEPETLLKLEGFRTDIQFKKDQTKIGYLTAKIARERNDIDRQKLQVELDKTKTERDEKLRAKVADAESGAASIDNMLNNIERILSVAIDKDGKPTSTLRAAAGPLDSRIPTMQTDVADLEALVDTLGAQAFLSQIPNIKGMGALSNAEGEKLQSAFQNFSLKQSPGQVISNLKEAKRLLGAGRNALSKRYGVPLAAPDTPAAPKPAATSVPTGWSVTVEGN